MTINVIQSSLHDYDFIDNPIVLKLSQVIVNAGVVELLFQFIDSNQSTARLPAIMAIGYIAGHSADLALTLIEAQVTY